MSKLGIGIAAGTLALAAGGVTPVAAQNLVTNPGFETYSMSAIGHFSGWTADANPDTHETQDPLAAHTGNYYADFGATTTALKGISQSLTTSIGTLYTFSFYVAGDVVVPGDGGNEFKAYFGNNLALDLVNNTTPTYTLESFTYLATSTSTTIQFLGRDDFNSLRLDDVSVVVTPVVPPSLPEMSTWALFIVGFGGVGAALRRRSSRAAALA